MSASRNQRVEADLNEDALDSPIMLVGSEFQREAARNLK